MEKIVCPNCNTELDAAAVATFENDSKLTVAYELKDGHKMTVRDFAQSIKALSDALKLTAKDLGAPKVEVFIHDMKVLENRLEITVVTALVEQS